MREPELEGRDGEIYSKHLVHRWSQNRIAAHFGLSQQRVSQILAAATEEMRGAAQAELIRESQATLAYVKAKYLELIEMTGAPVTSGKDGDIVIDPETQAVVRDYSLRAGALAGLRATDAELAKRLGLNAPEKAQVESTVKYVIEGVDTGNLT